MKALLITLHTYQIAAPLLPGANCLPTTQDVLRKRFLINPSDNKEFANKGGRSDWQSCLEEAVVVVVLHIEYWNTVLAI